MLFNEKAGAHEPGAPASHKDAALERQAPHVAASTFPPRAQEEGIVPPGLVGELATYIYENAPYPNWNVAIAASLAFLSAIFGRNFNVSGTGLNLWIGIAGETAIGKEAAQSGIGKVVAQVQLTCPLIVDFIGASKWASAEAMHKRLARTPAVLGFVGELGIKMKAWCSVKANPVFANLVGFMLDTYGKSGDGGVLQSQENSDREKGAAAVVRPCLSLLGDTTLTTLNEALDEASIANGFLPRWVFIFAGAKRGKYNKRRSAPPASLVECVAAAAVATQGGWIHHVALEPDAEAEADLIERQATAAIENTSAEVTRHLYNRAYLNTLKIAAVCAIGRAKYGVPTICLDDILWAKRVVFSGIDNIVLQFSNGEVGDIGGNQSKQQTEVKRVIREYFAEPFERFEKYGVLEEMHKNKVVPDGYIQRRLITLTPFTHDRAGASKAIKAVIDDFLKQDELREIPKAQMVQTFGCGPRAYAVTRPKVFLGI